MSEHTRGEWIADGANIYGPKHDRSEHTNGRQLVAGVCDEKHALFPSVSGGFDTEAIANRDHIVALHNAAEQAGIENPAAIPTAIKAARRCLGELQDYFMQGGPDWWEEADAAGVSDTIKYTRAALAAIKSTEADRCHESN